MVRTDARRPSMACAIGQELDGRRDAGGRTPDRTAPDDMECRSMATQQNKTTPNDQDVTAFLAGIDDPRRREDSQELCRLMAEVTGEPAVMWGSSIVGFGQYHFRYDSGREGDYLAIGFSPRKASLTLYLMDGVDRYEAPLRSLGPHTTGRSCLYVKRLGDVDRDVLRQIIQQSYASTMGELDQTDGD
jgi:hypothetical protein